MAASALTSLICALQPAILPKTTRLVRVLCIARISTEKQDEKSLEDQVARCQAFLDEHLGLPYELRIIATQGSGEQIDRKEILEAYDAVESNQIDLVLMEDLGRLMRRAHAKLFCELCVDHETRLIALNDNIDTARDDWHILANVASLRHEMYNSDGSKRIRRSLRNRFTNGGIVQTVIFGYIKPERKNADEPVTDTELQRDPSAEPIFQDCFRLLRDGASYSEVADRLNKFGIPVGPQCRSKRWYGPMVKRIVHNPILKGWRVRNRVMSQRHNKTGRRRSIKAPPTELLVRKCPHLAFFTEEYFDETIAMLDTRNAGFKRKLVNGRDPRAGVPKKQSRWPGQHCRCGICGRVMQYGGNGKNRSLICRGASEYKCWNGITIDSELASARLCAVILEAIEKLPGFESALMDKVREAAKKRCEAGQLRRMDIERRLVCTDHAMHNVAAAIGATGHSPTLLGKLDSLETENSDLKRELKAITAADSQCPEIPSIESVRVIARQKFEELARHSPEFGRWMRKIVTRLEMLPVRLCDGGTPEPRAFVTVDLTPLVPTDVGTACEDLLRVHLVVDLFNPPQRVTLRKEIESLVAAGLTQRDIAARFGTHQATVQKMLSLSRRIEKLGLAEPYVILFEPPADYAKMRRIKHPRYRFEPLEGYPRTATS